MRNKIIRSIKLLHDYCMREEYKGYSLYDSHNGIIPFHKFGHKISFYANQIIKRSPINFRPLLGIKKGSNPKGYGLFLNAYSKLKNLGHVFYDEELLDSLNHRFFKWLLRNPSKGYSGYCWGYNYDWPKSNGKFIPTYTPSGVVTGFNCRAILSYYNIYKDDKAKEIIKSASSFVLNDLHLSETEYGLCFSYTPIEKDLTINANLLAVEILVYDDYLQNKNEHYDLIQGGLDFTEKLQNKDGSWYYSYENYTLIPKKQIDFHQGYILESIKYILEYSEINMKRYKNVLNKGLDFYYRNQFHPNGYSYWRYPKKWPVDIHNQSQGIITFSMFKELDKKFLPFAKKIAFWTIENMQDREGNFYYQKWPFLTNKVNYMRWNQAWMLLALTNLLENLEKD